MTKRKEKPKIPTYILIAVALLSFLLSMIFLVQLLKLEKQQHLYLEKGLNRLATQVLTLSKNRNMSAQKLQTDMMVLQTTDPIFTYILSDKGKILSAPDKTAVGKSFKSLSIISPDLPGNFKVFSKSDATQKNLVFSQTKSQFLTAALLLKLNNYYVLVITKHVTSHYFSFVYKKKRMLFFLILFLGMTAIAIWLIYVRKYFKTHPAVALLTSFYYAVLFVCLVVELLYYHTPERFPIAANMLSNWAQVHHLTAKHKERLGTQANEIQLVPVGAYVTNIVFENKHSVTLTLWLWLKDIENYSRNIRIVLPQMISGSHTEIMKSESASRLLHFNSVQLKQVFNEDTYPFDYRYVAIAISTTEMFNPTILLYPDLDSYNLINKDNLLTSQISPNLHIKNWHVLDSYFITKKSIMSARMAQDIDTINKLPDELYLEILLKRDLTTPFITDYLPLLIVLMMFFIGKLMSDKVKPGASIFGYLTYNASLLFVVTLSAVHAREQLSSNRLSFIGISYIIVYVIIVFYTLMQAYRHFVIKDVNRAKSISNIMRLSYWPVVTLGFLGDTLFYFW